MSQISKSERLVAVLQYSVYTVSLSPINIIKTNFKTNGSTRKQVLQETVGSTRKPRLFVR